MAELKYACETCPANCTSADLPAVEFNDCTDAVKSEESEITDIWISPEDDTVAGPKYKPSLWTSEATYVTATNQSGAGLKHLTVIGDKGLPEAVGSRTISKGRIVPGESKHTINFDVDDVTDANYTFMRRLQCGGKQVFWYKTKGGYVYGGPNGIPTNIENAGEVLARGEGNYAVFQYIASWKAKCSPPRALLAA